MNSGLCCSVLERLVDAFSVPRDRGFQFDRSEDAAQVRSGWFHRPSAADWRRADTLTESVRMARCARYSPPQRSR